MTGSIPRASWGRPLRWMKTLFDVRRSEVGPVVTAACGFFFVLTALMLLRPVRDAIGMVRGVETIRWLFMTTAVVTLALNPVFGFLVGRLRRPLFVAATYGFFCLTLVVFWVLLTFAPFAIAQGGGQAFYVWFSVINVFGTMVFWALVSDHFTREQSARLFALIAIGGTLGAVFGPWLTSRLAEPLGAIHLLPVSALFLSLGALAAWRLARITPSPMEARMEGEAHPSHGPAPIGGGAWDGLHAVVRSPYLAGIAGYVMLMAMMATFVYLTRLQLVAGVAAEPDAMAALLARIDMWTQLVFLALQLAMATRFTRRVDTGHALVLLPLATALGFASLAAQGALLVLFLLDAANRAVQRGVARPAREMLFTVVPRNDKYKAKAVIDTFVYRMGDVLGAQMERTLAGAGWTVGGLAGVAVPLALAWAALAMWLGRLHRKRGNLAPSGAGPFPRAR